MGAEKVSSEEVSEIIYDLRVWFGVKTDGELAKALRLDPSSVSNWRRRGAVPKAYRDILTGEAPSPHFLSRDKWTDIERNAFAIALYWFAVSKVDILKDGGYPGRLAFLTHVEEFWVYVSDALLTLERMQQSGGYADHSINAAFSIVTDYPPDIIKNDVRSRGPKLIEGK